MRQAHDANFEINDPVRVRLSATEWKVGFVASKPTISRPLYEVRLSDDRVVEVTWFHIHHYRPETVTAAPAATQRKRRVWPRMPAA